MVATVCAELKTERTHYEILQIFSKSLLSKTLVYELLTKHDCKNIKESESILLLFSYIRTQY